MLLQRQSISIVPRQLKRQCNQQLQDFCPLRSSVLLSSFLLMFPHENYPLVPQNSHSSASGHLRHWKMFGAPDAPPALSLVISAISSMPGGRRCPCSHSTLSLAKQDLHNVIRRGEDGAHALVPCVEDIGGFIVYFMPICGHNWDSFGLLERYLRNRGKKGISSKNSAHTIERPRVGLQVSRQIFAQSHKDAWGANEQKRFGGSVALTRFYLSRVSNYYSIISAWLNILLLMLWSDRGLTTQPSHKGAIVLLYGGRYPLLAHIRARRSPNASHSPSCWLHPACRRFRPRTHSAARPFHSDLGNQDRPESSSRAWTGDQQTSSRPGSTASLIVGMGCQRLMVARD
jgi:hypothetical protein